MASTKVIEAKLDKLSGEISALRLEVLSRKAPRRKAAEDLKAAWRQLGRKVSRSWKTGTAAGEISAQRTKGA